VGSAAADSSYLFDEVCYAVGGSVRYFRTDIDKLRTRFDHHFERAPKIVSSVVMKSVSSKEVSRTA
jgi:hypothetical protein